MTGRRANESPLECGSHVAADSAGSQIHLLLRRLMLHADGNFDDGNDDEANPRAPSGERGPDRDLCRWWRAETMRAKSFVSLRVQASAQGAPGCIAVRSP